jgi:tol-pal system protein YbgF
MRGRTALASAACLAVLAAGGCASTPEQDPVQIKLNDLDTRLGRIERVVANQSLLDLANQVEALRGEVRALHNDIDVVNHTLDTARKQQHDLYADLDQRLKTLEARAGTVAAPSGAGSGDGAAEGADKGSYQAAFELLKSGQYERAIAALQSFLTAYPNSQLADNAQYWLGEAYYVNRSFPEALAAFQRVAESYPSSRKLPDALLKIGFCEYELKDYPAARVALLHVTTKFPDSSAAPLAQQRLDKLAAEQH